MNKILKGILGGLAVLGGGALVVSSLKKTNNQDDEACDCEYEEAEDENVVDEAE